MQVKGIKRGQNIELLEQIESIPDGAEITITIDPPRPDPETFSLTSFIGAAKGSFATPAAVDEFIRQERDAWEF